MEGGGGRDGSCVPCIYSHARRQLPQPTRVSVVVSYVTSFKRCLTRLVCRFIVNKGVPVFPGSVARREDRSNGFGHTKLQALVYDILPSTTAVFSYAIGFRKLSIKEQFFVGAQTVVGLLQTTKIKQGVSFIAANKFYTSTNKTSIV